MGWFFLIGAVILEVFGTISMRLSEGFQHLWPTVTMIASYISCFALLTLSLKSFDLGLAYAIWAGLGTALTVGAGIFLFQEPLNATKVISVALIIIGVVGLNLSGSH